jgi:DNA-binding IclR family transcriptional regulator
MLAFAGEDRINEVIAAGLERRTARTVVDPNELRAQLQATCRSSVAYDDQESIDGLGCVAAPIRSAGRAIAAVSVCGPIDEIDFERLAGPVRRAAQAIWAEAFGPVA